MGGLLPLLTREELECGWLRSLAGRSLLDSLSVLRLSLAKAGGRECLRATPSTAVLGLGPGPIACCNCKLLLVETPVKGSRRRLSWKDSTVVVVTPPVNWASPDPAAAALLPLGCVAATPPPDVGEMSSAVTSGARVLGGSRP